MKRSIVLTFAFIALASPCVAMKKTVSRQKVDLTKRVLTDGLRRANTLFETVYHLDKESMNTLLATFKREDFAIPAMFEIKDFAIVDRNTSNIFNRNEEEDAYVDVVKLLLQEFSKDPNALFMCTRLLCAAHFHKFDHIKKIVVEAMKKKVELYEEYAREKEGIISRKAEYYPILYKILIKHNGDTLATTIPYYVFKILGI